MNKPLPSEPSNSTDAGLSTGSGSGAGGREGRHHASKLTARQVWEIRRIYDANVAGQKRTTLCRQMQRWLAKKFNTPVGTIDKIVLRVTWRKPCVGKSWAEWERENGLSP